jgi:hypothetical protein
MLVPISILFPQTAELPQHTLSWPVFTFLATVIGVARVFASMHFSCVSMMLNESVTNPNHRGTMNGLSSLGGSVLKAIAPVFAGIAYAACVNTDSWSPEIGSFIAFSTLATASCLVAFIAIKANIERFS